MRTRIEVLPIPGAIILRCSWIAPVPALPQGWVLAKRALSLDPGLAEAHLSMGGIKLLIERDWAGAEASLTRALELQPRLAVARAYRSFIFATRREWERARADAKQVMDDEPDLRLICYLAAATHYRSGDLVTATRLIERALELEPRAVFIHWLRSWVFTVSGWADEAITESLKAVIAEPASTDYRAGKSPLTASGSSCSRRRS